MLRKPKHWLHLENALPAFENLTGEWIDRAALQEALDCSQTEAWRILRRLGAEPGPGGALILPKRGLSRTAPESISPMPALSSNSAGERGSTRKEDRAADALGLINTRFGNLPAGVELTPTSLHIEFQGREEFSRASALCCSQPRTTLNA